MGSGLNGWVGGWMDGSENMRSTEEGKAKIITGKQTKQKEEVGGFTWRFGLIGDNATNKVRLRLTQSGHQLVQLFLHCGGRYTGRGYGIQDVQTGR